jgi:hypothetical protein
MKYLERELKYSINNTSHKTNILSYNNLLEMNAKYKGDISKLDNVYTHYMELESSYNKLFSE